MKTQPFEIRNLFNPVFCSLLLYDGAKGYFELAQSGIDYSLCFLLLPATLHQKTRRLLPGSSRTKLHVWLQRKPEVRFGFSHRATGLSSLSRDGLLFGLQAGILKLSREGTVLAAESQLSKYKFQVGTEAAECRLKAKLLGKLFAQAGQPKDIFLMWGVKP